jgi:hypothetical protein
VALELFTKLQQKSTLLFLQTYPTPQAALAASAEQITEVLRRAKHSHPISVAAEIVERLHQPHLQADAVTTRAKSRLLLVLVSQLLPLLEQIRQYDKEIGTLFLTHEDHELFASLPRAGKRLAPRLLAEIGDDRTRDLDASSLQALGGTSPVLCAKRDVLQSASAHGLYQTVAQCLAPVCLADHAKRTVGQRLLPTQASRRQEPYGRRARAGQCVGQDHLCHVAASAML